MVFFAKAVLILRWLQSQFLCTVHTLCSAKHYVFVQQSSLSKPMGKVHTRTCLYYLERNRSDNTAKFAKGETRLKYSLYASLGLFAYVLIFILSPTNQSKFASLIIHPYSWLPTPVLAVSHLLTVMCS